MSTSRIATLLAVTLSLLGCGGDSGLVAQGSFLVSGTLAGDPISTGVNLVQETRLDAGGLVTGACVVTETATDRSITIDLFTNGAADPNQLRHASIATRVDGTTAALSADVGLRTFSASDCAVSVDLLDNVGNAVIATVSSCTLSASDGSTLDATTDLAIFGCRVVHE